MVKLNSEDITTAVRKISQRLTAIVDKPEDYGSLDTQASVQLLVAIAFHGAKLRSALVTDTPGLAQVMAGRDAAIQIVAAKPDAYFPFEFAYDFPIPQPRRHPVPGRGRHPRRPRSSGHLPRRARQRCRVPVGVLGPAPRHRAPRLPADRRGAGRLRAPVDTPTP